MSKASQYELIAWSSSVKERDGHSCQWCGSLEDLQAHHIKPKSSRPDLALDLNNGVTLCADCHIKAHSDEPYVRNLLRARKMSLERNGGKLYRERKSEKNKPDAPKPTLTKPASGDGMTGSEFREALEAVGMKPAAFSIWLGINRATVFRWLQDGPPLYCQRVMELLLERKNLAERLSDIP